ncbi:MAG: hypothetical protein M1407_04125 [Deltaproteobacteria bacterium]|nr:hypothetical protein [Deltaproteobacteria bacterium]
MSDKFLKHELDRYKDNLETLLVNEGRFVLIKDDDNFEFFDTYDDALKAGYEKYGVEPFLVHKISRIESTANFTRSLKISCQV